MQKPEALDFRLESRPCPKCSAAMVYNKGEPWYGPTWGCTSCGHTESAAKAEPADSATMCVWCETRVGDACKSHYDTLTCAHRVIAPTAKEFDFAIEARAADARKPCTCDGAGRGPGRACVVKAGGRLGDLWRCSEGCNGCDDCTDYEP